MADSARETALKTLKAALDGIAWTATDAPDIARNAPEAADIPPGGRIVQFDGDPGEPEVLLSPPVYVFTHSAELNIQVQAASAAVRDAAMDAILQDIAGALNANPTLSGAVDNAAPGTPEITDEPVDGGATVKAVLLPVFLEYTAPTPLG